LQDAAFQGPAGAWNGVCSETSTDITEQECDMLDTLVIGAGLCGLSLATKLQFAGRDYLLVESRMRLGGRIESVRGAHGMTHDLGPAWFWPETQPRIARLIGDLGLSTFPQHDSGTILHLSRGDGSPEALPQPGVHNGAQRVSGGMRSIVDALARRLAVERLRMGYEVTRLFDRGDHIEAHCWTGQETVVLSARNVVLAVPPRLVDERIAFEPPMEVALVDALRATPTWMAAQAKAVAGFEASFWRDSALSGNAFVTHPQAVLAEVFDASAQAGSAAALGGFVALPAAARTAFQHALPMMISSQFGQLFGPRAAEDGDLHLRDWASERFTCSALDAAGRNEHPEDGTPELAVAPWAGKLNLAGSETAAQGAGYLEGALEAAARVWKHLGVRAAADEEEMSMTKPVTKAASKPLPHASPAPAPLPVLIPINEDSLGRFAEWVAAQRRLALSFYRQGLTRALSSQRGEQVTQRIVLEVVEDIYREALRKLAELPFETRDVNVEKGRSALTQRALEPFLGFSDTLLSEAVTHNATSCAISNFPAEHDPDAAYLQSIRRDLAAAWREFALGVNDLMLDRAESSTH
jgi:monoamine oxidase